ncbi:MAG: glutathione-disulfide reductase [Rhodospirillaceae bacterium]|nr:glutathione-disulfide reductase [Rhodospirillaceae bacterium]
MTAEYDYDLIVIGAGSGGVRAGRIAAGFGARVAVIEEDRPGGTCVIRGCVPKKLLVYGSSIGGDLEDATGFGWKIDKAIHDWPALIAAKDRELERLEGIYRKLLESAGAELISGRGKIVGPHQVSVNERKISGETILIATGGRPQIPDVLGLRQYAITSTEALDLKNLPERIVVYGGGYIALEFASIFRGFGSEVHLVYRGDLPLRGFDDDVRKHMAEALLKRGINIHHSATITAVCSDEKQLAVELSDGQAIVSDQILAATGRVPNTQDLGLESTYVKLSHTGAICVDENSRTNINSIFAVGDVTDRINLTPVAIAEAHAFADSLFGQKNRQANHKNVASAVFSQPPVASVGQTEDEARQEHGELDIYESHFNPMKNTLSGRNEQTYMKLIVASSSQKILGIHMVGSDSAEIMQGLAIAVNMGATKEDFDAVIGIHPTAAEEFVTMRTKRQG